MKDLAIQFPQDLEEHLEKIKEMKEVVLANAVMCGEIPAPTFQESERIAFLKDRFIEAGLEHISVDEMDNVAAVLPGAASHDHQILLSANIDTVDYGSVDHSMMLGTDTITGPGICDNSVGIGVLASIPLLLDRLGIQLQSDVILLGSSQSIGVGDLGGIRFFLDHYKKPIRAGVCMRGVQIGRLSYASLGMLRGEIQISMPEEYDWKKLRESSAIVVLNQLITKIQAIPLPSSPVTSIVLGSVQGGNTFGTSATTARLRFEIRSEEEGRTTEIEKQLLEIVEEIAAESDADTQLTVVARRDRGGISFSHPLVRSTRRILEMLEMDPVIAPSTGELCALIERNIPSVTVGLSTGEHIHENNETLRIAPLFKGIAQVLALLQAMDGEENDG